MVAISSDDNGPVPRVMRKRGVERFRRLLDATADFSACLIVGGEAAASPTALPVVKPEAEPSTWGGPSGNILGFAGLNRDSRAELRHGVVG